MFGYRTGRPGAIIRGDTIAELSLDLSIFRIHQLKGRLRGHWSIWVSGNWRVTFRFIDTDVELVGVLHEHARISPNLAVRLEAAGVGTARSWLAMQLARDLAEGRPSGTPKVRRLDTVA